MDISFRLYVVLSVVAVAVMLALHHLSSRRYARRPTAQGARARVERRGSEVTVVVPPQPGARWFVVIWTLAVAAFMAYVCVIIDTSPFGWVLFMGGVTLFAALVAASSREFCTWYFVLRGDGTARVACALRWVVVKEEKLSPRGQHGAVRMGRDRDGIWYFQYAGRIEDERWGRLSDEDAATLRAFGVPDDGSAPDPLPERSLAEWFSQLWYVVLLGLFAYPLLLPLGKIQGLPAPRLEGSFRAEHAALGSWQLTPKRCLSGRERGFEGVLFAFPQGGAVRELRIDMERPGDAALEFHFFEPDKQPVRIAQRECERIDGNTNARVVVINGRDMDVLTGNVEIACASYGLTGSASYEGCLP